MSAKRITLEQRNDNIMVWTTPEIKEQLRAVADRRGWSLSLLCHEILREWLESEAKEK